MYIYILNIISLTIAGLGARHADSGDGHMAPLHLYRIGIARHRRVFPSTHNTNITTIIDSLQELFHLPNYKAP